LGGITKNEVPDSLRSVCERLPDIIDEINHNYSMHLRQLLLCDKTEIFAADYKAISDLLKVSASIDSTEFKADQESSLRLCDVLSENKLAISSAIVYGSKRQRIILTADSLDYLEKKGDELLPILERAIGKPLVIEKTEKQGDRALMQVCERKRLTAEHTTRGAASVFENEFCGDSTAIFETGDGILYSLISDGMGAGRDAALTSGICAMFLEKMLTASASCETSLRMLNVFLRNKGGTSVHECSATVDLCELDLVSGKTSIYKSGAAPSFLLRGGKLYKLRSNTLPLGIIKELDAKRLTFEAKDGDVIIMASDGVTAGDDECRWLLDILNESINTRSLKRCAELILERARRENENDDVSVTLIKIKNNT
jgi:stage II sporulation protein E